MATKWKNTEFWQWAKGFAFLLTLGVALFLGFLAPDLPKLRFAFEPADYEKSADSERLIHSLDYALSQIVELYINEEHVLTGQSIAPDMEEYKKSLSLGNEKDRAFVIDSYNGQIAEARRSGALAEAEYLEQEQQNLLQELEEQFAQNLLIQEACLLRIHLEEYHRHLALLNTPKAYYYHATFPDGNLFSNLLPGQDPDTLFAALPSRINMVSGESFRHVGIRPEHHTYLASAHAYNRNIGIGIAYRLAACLALLLLALGLLYASLAYGGESALGLRLFDRIYLDLGLAAFFIAFLVLVSTVPPLPLNAETLSPEMLQLAVGGGLTVLFLSGMLYFHVFCKRALLGEVLRHTLIYNLLRGLWNLLQKAFRSISRVLSSGPALWRNGLYLALHSLLFGFFSFLLFAAGGHNAAAAALGLGGILVLTAGVLWWLWRRTEQLNAILEGTELIKQGRLGYRLPHAANSDLNALTEKINNIAFGLERAVSKEVRAERMKTELITNVSHDLKTPLTSVITYIDLLKTEGLGAEGAPGYLEVLERKAERLRVLTDDLLEAAKAASGNVNLRMERIDLTALLSQGLGELTDKLEASTLDWRVSMPEEKLYVVADGRLLWRVVENLLSNIFKYALPASRVYVEAARQDRDICITLKNISQAPLNMAADELMERFVRADSARQGEGSGLGLAIAKDLTELQGGKFTVTIDGDLFKVAVCLPAALPEEE